MANYTNQDIQDAYKQTVGSGAMSEADFVSQAMDKYGVSADQLRAAQGGLLSSAAPSAPAYDQNTINTVYEEQVRAGNNADDVWNAGKSQYGLTDEQLRSAQSAFNQKTAGLRNWANGKSADEVLRAAESANLSPQDIALIFGANSKQVQDLVGVSNIGGQYRYGRYQGDPSNARTLATGANPLNLKYDSATNTWSESIPRRAATSGGSSSDYAPVLNRQVDAANETIEGRIRNLLGTDATGNFTNPVVRQAVDRAMQAFAGRGLLNSSMAQQAAQEAAISKAIEIAGPDAQTYFQQGRANQDASNLFARDQTQYGYDLGKIAAQGDQNIRAQNNQNAFTASQQQKQNDFTASQNQLNRDFTSSERTATQTWTAGENALNRQAQLTAAANSASASMQAAGISANTQLAVANMNRQYQQMGNLSSTASSMYTNYFTGVYNITNSDLSSEAKDAAINKLTTVFQSGVALQGAINGDVDMQSMMASLFPKTAASAPSPAPSPAPAPAPATPVAQQDQAVGNG